MTKSDLIRLLSQRYPEFQRSVVEKTVTLFFDEIVKALVSDKRVELRGFGTFSCRIRHPRWARNPRTGEAVHVSEKRVPFFKASRELIPLSSRSVPQKKG